MYFEVRSTCTLYKTTGTTLLASTVASYYYYTSSSGLISRRGVDEINNNTTTAPTFRHKSVKAMARSLLPVLALQLIVLISSSTDAREIDSTPKTIGSHYATNVRRIASASFFAAGASALLARTQPVAARANSVSVNQLGGMAPSVLPVASLSLPVAAETNDDDSLLNGMISGAATRISKELLLHPLDTVRARLQVPPDFVRDESNQKGLYDGLYDGVVPALVGGIPAGALFFGVKDYSKKRFKKLGLNKLEETVASVALANVLYWVIRNPAEVRKTTEQIGADNLSSIDAVRRVYENGGVGGLVTSLQSSYESYPSNYVYALPADVVKFMAYEMLTASVFGKADGEKVEGLQAAATGAAAGLIAQALTTPVRGGDMFSLASFACGVFLCLILAISLVHLPPHSLSQHTHTHTHTSPIHPMHSPTPPPPTHTLNPRSWTSRGLASCHGLKTKPTPSPTTPTPSLRSWMSSNRKALRLCSPASFPEPPELSPVERSNSHPTN